MRPLLSLTIIASAVLMFGCASKKAAVQKPLEATVVGTGPRIVPQTFEPANTPVPVYINPQIVAVYMSPYENERGEWIFPTEKRVIRRKGHWNIDASRNPDRSYIPEENTAPVPGAETWTPMVMPGSPKTLEEMAPTGTDVAGKATLRMLQSPRDIRVLKLFDRSQETLARTQLRKGEVLVYDADVGFVAIPEEQLYNTPVSVPGLREEIRVDKVLEKTEPTAPKNAGAGQSTDDGVK